MARNRIEFAVRVKDEASHNLQRVSREVDGLTDSLKALGAGFISVATIGEIARLADTYRLVSNRLRIVTSSTAELNTIQNELIDLSNRTRSSFTATSDLYSRVARSSRNLGLSQQDLLDFTETVSKSIRISGSTAQEAAAGVIQFGQALASSRLSGDELRSVLEQMPRLARAIAEGMGVGIGRLREMGEQGELTADRVIDAINKVAPEIASEFDELAPLVSEALTTVESSLTAIVGELDEFYGVSVVVANAIITVRDEVLELARIFLGAAKEGDQLSDSTQKIAIAMVVAAGSVGILATSLKETLSAAFNNVGTAIGGFAAQIVALAKGDFEGSKEIFAEWTGDIKEGFIKDFSELNDELAMQMTNTMETIGKIIGEFPVEQRDPFDLSDRPAKGIMITKQELIALAQAQKEAEKVWRSTRTEVEEFILSMQELRDLREKFPDIIDPETFERAAKALQDDMFPALDNLKEQWDGTAEFMKNVAERAAQNIQDAFADFLFDPFDDGIRGMLEGFLTALRRMLAEALSFQILTGIPGVGDFLGLTKRAAGGPVFAGQPVLVGERGPELFIPGASGTVRSNAALSGDKMGSSGMQFVTNIDARGADPGLIARLPAMMEQRDKKLLLKVKEYIETGGIRI